MPPPISNPGTRTGLIATTVGSIIVAVTAMIFAIYFSVRLSKVTDQHETYRKRYTGIVSEPGLASPDIETLRAQKEKVQGPSETVFDIAMSQSRTLATLVGGGPDIFAAADSARRALSSAGEKATAAGVTLQAADLSGAINALADATTAKQAEIERLTQQLKDATARVEATEKRLQDMTAAKDKDIADARAELARAVEEAEADRSSKNEQIATIQQGISTDREKWNQATLAGQTQRRDLEARIKRLETDLAATRARIGRGTNTTEGVVRRGDGYIVRLPGNNIAYINLGSGDQVSPGLTFEVYDKNEGVPVIPAGATDEDVPQGKASMEIIRVGATSSECRITRVSPGVTLTEGDIISNLVYDPNTKFSFLVYGNFDLDQNGVATPGDTNVIKQLITQWGGQNIDTLNVNTDFVVLGKEPELPNFSREELEEPINRKKYDDAVAALNAFQEVVSKAQSLNVPIMNQNRFLYYVGYYDTARR